MTAYQVVAEMAAHVEVNEPGGRSVQTFYQGAVLPDGVPAERVKALLDRGIIATVGEAPIAPNASVEQDPARGLASVTSDVLRGEKPETPREDPALNAARRVAATVTEEGRIDNAAGPTAEEQAIADKRSAAKAKLPEDGSAPDGRASEPVMVEWLVTKGYSYDELVKQDKAELKSLIASAK